MRCQPAHLDSNQANNLANNPDSGGGDCKRAWFPLPRIFLA
jgi:hypothetical protein